MEQTEEGFTVIVEEWVGRFQSALAARDAEKISGLFVHDGYWRDLVAFTWDLGWVSGSSRIAERLLETDAREKSSRWRIAEDFVAPRLVARVGRQVVEGFLEFDTATGPGVGLVRLDVSQKGSPPRAWVLLTKLDDFHSGSTIRRNARPEGVGFPRTADPRNWLDRRMSDVEYADREPDVIVVGGGHSGVFTAANLRRLGVDVLVVDRLPRVGDNWRTRYHSLALHNKTDMVHFPFMPFPGSFPEYLPKDKLANWFEAYVDAMELNYWTSAEFQGGTYDENDRRWTVAVMRDGAPRVLRPRHLVMATGGVGGAPNIPSLPGLETFEGNVIHSKHFRSGADLAGKNAIVVGVGTSAHDIAYDLHRNGATVTLLQRNATSVVSLDSANKSYPQYGDGTPIDEADLLASAGFIFPLMKQSFQMLHTVTAGLDRDLLENLGRAGMALDDGEDGCGWFLKFYQRAGGYYINVGCSELIIDGSIDVVQMSDVETFDTTELVMADGRRIPADVVVLATGYQNQQSEVRGFFGDEIADRIGLIGAFDDDGELRNAWRQTSQPGIWFMVSGFSSARIHAPLVALQIRGDLDGVAKRPARLETRSVDVTA